MISILVVILRFLKMIFTSITKITMHHLHRHHSHRSLRFQQHQKRLLRKILLPGLIASRAPPLMNFWNSGLCLRKTSKLVIHFIGGMAAVLSFRIYIISFVTYFQSQVCYYYFMRYFSYYTYGLKGSAVAVERIFSGGRDTISLRRASLKPDTIRVLMLVKKKLHLEREKSKNVLHKN